MFVSQPQKSFDKFPRLSFMGGGGSLAKNVNRLCDPKVRAKLSQINVRSDNKSLERTAWIQCSSNSAVRMNHRLVV